jgi:hypothetical protein
LSYICFLYAISVVLSQLCYRGLSISHFFRFLGSSGHVMPFGRDIYGDYIYSPLTVTHARKALRDLSCWLGVICLTSAK